MAQPTPCTTGNVLATAISWDIFRAALYKFVPNKAVRIDGWNAYLPHRAPSPVQKCTVCTCVERNEFPMEWRQWVAMLSLKQAGHAHVMNTYRDLWIVVPHSQKLLMPMLDVEYKRVSGMTVSSSQAGWVGEKQKDTRASFHRPGNPRNSRHTQPSPMY